MSSEVASVSASDTMKERGVIIIGAGVAGIAMGAQLQRKLGYTDFEIFEEFHEIGGTWAKNTYPGLECDVGAHPYSFSFAPNPDWSQSFSTQPEILTYLKDVATKYSLPERTHLNHKLMEARWDADAQRWTIRLENTTTGESVHCICKVLVVSASPFNVLRGIEEVLPGHENYTGICFHSGNWDHSIDFTGKNVVVIGNGCSATQLIPRIAKHTKSVTQFVRSAHWLMPKGTKKYGSWFKWMMRYIPGALLFNRFLGAFALEMIMLSSRNNFISRKMRAIVQHQTATFMQQNVPEKYRDALIPKYPLGAKRVVFDDGYLNTIAQDNFHLSTKQLIGADGKYLLDESGERHDADILILANGYNTQEIMAPSRIYGINGVELREKWKELGGPRAYQGVAVSGFPNMMLLGGPNAWFPGNSIPCHEGSVTYAIRLMAPILSPRNKASSIMVRFEAEEAYDRWVQGQTDTLTYRTVKRSWLLNEKTGRATVVWPRSALEWWLWTSVAPVKWRDFVVTSAKEHLD